MRDSTYYRHKAREAFAHAQTSDDRSAKLGWLDLAERCRRLGESQPRGRADSTQAAIEWFDPVTRRD